MDVPLMWRLPSWGARLLMLCHNVCVVNQVSCCFPSPLVLAYGNHIATRVVCLSLRQCAHSYRYYEERRNNAGRQLFLCRWRIKQEQTIKETVFSCVPGYTPMKRCLVASTYDQQFDQQKQGNACTKDHHIFVLVFLKIAPSLFLNWHRSALDKSQQQEI